MGRLITLSNGWSGPWVGQLIILRRREKEERSGNESIFPMSVLCNGWLECRGHCFEVFFLFWAKGGGKGGTQSSIP
jgi:hypothetical protein